MSMRSPSRRSFVKAVGAPFTTSIFTGNVSGVNDRLVGAFIGTGVMGRGNLNSCLHQGNVVVKAVCDVYEPNLQKAVDSTGGKAKPVRDFRLRRLAAVADQWLHDVRPGK